MLASHAGSFENREQGQSPAADVGFHLRQGHAETAGNVQVIEVLEMEQDQGYPLMRRQPSESFLDERVALFRAETGMSLGQWQRRQTLLHALRRLAAGENVSGVAGELGYNSASAFIAMFRRELGQTPKRYFEA